MDGGGARGLVVDAHDERSGGTGSRRERRIEQNRLDGVEKATLAEIVGEVLVRGEGFQDLHRKRRLGRKARNRSADINGDHDLGLTGGSTGGDLSLDLLERGPHQTETVEVVLGILSLVEHVPRIGRQCLAGARMSPF